MVTSYYVSSNLLAMMQRPACPPKLSKYAEIIRSARQQSTQRSTLKSDLLTYKPTFLTKSERLGRQPVRLHDAVVKALQEALQTHIVLATEFFVLKSHSIKGVQYTSFEHSEAASHIYYFDRRRQRKVPGRVRVIFEYINRRSGTLDCEVFYAIHPFNEYTQTEADPFKAYPDFGASLWGDGYHSDVVVEPATSICCHIVWRRWTDTSYVIRPLDRVSSFSSESESYDLIFLSRLGYGVWAGHTYTRES